MGAVFRAGVLAAATALAAPLPVSAQQMTSVLHDGLALDMPEACRLRVEPGRGESVASCLWTGDGTWLLVVERSTHATDVLRGLSPERQIALLRSVCEYAVWVMLDEPPADCRASDPVVRGVAPGDLPPGAEFCLVGTEDLLFGSGDRAHRQILVCHLPVSRDTVRVFSVSVMGDAPKPAVARLADAIFRSVEVRD